VTGNPAALPHVVDTRATKGRRHSSRDTRDGEDGNMATDEDYMDFLDKANRDPGEGYPPGAQSTSAEKQMRFRATEEGVRVPAVLRGAVEEGVLYVSESDEPFVEVALAYGGESLPDEGELSSSGIPGFRGSGAAALPLSARVGWVDYFPLSASLSEVWL